MKKFTKILVLALCACMLFSVAACGGGEENDGRTKVKVAFYMAGFGDAWMKDLEAKYEALHSDVNIVLEGDPYIEDTVWQRLDAKKPELVDDLGIFAGSFYRRMVREDMLEPLDALYGEVVEGEDTIDDIVNHQLKDYFTVNGKTYALPWQDNAMSFVYNANMFKQYNWPIPQTMDQFFALCEQIRKDTNNAVAPLAICGKANQGYLPTVMDTWLSQYEGVDAMMDFFKCENAEVYQAQEAGRKKVYETVAKLLHGKTSTGQTYLDANSKGYNHLGAQSALLSGEAAMVVSGPWIQIEMSEYLVDYPNFQMKIMPVPHINADMKDKNGNDSQYVRTSSTGVMVIPKDAANKEIAKDFVKFMLTQENLEAFVEKTDGLTRPYTLKNPENCTLNPFGQSVLELLSTHQERMLYTVSTSPMWLANEASMWQAADGAAVTKLMGLQSLDQAMAACGDLAKEDYTRIKNKWDTWQIA